MTEDVVEKKQESSKNIWEKTKELPWYLQILLVGLGVYLFWYLFLRVGFPDGHWVLRLRDLMPVILGVGFAVFVVVMVFKYIFVKQKSERQLHTIDVIKKNVREYFAEKGITTNYYSMEVDRLVIGTAISLVHIPERHEVCLYMPSYPWPHLVASKKDQIYSYRRAHEHDAMIKEYLKHWQDKMMDYGEVPEL